MAGPVEREGVVGSGLMGAEIAFVFARAGFHVLMADKETTRLDAALARLRTRARRSRWRQRQARVALTNTRRRRAERLMRDEEGDGHA